LPNTRFRRANNAPTINRADPAQTTKIDYNDFIDITLERMMASITIRNLDESIKAMLRLQAAQHGWSMEQEAREILRRSLLPAENASGGFAQRIHQRFATLQTGSEQDALPIPARRATRPAPDLGS
jgi:plasmid stability protein